jgi:O-succinylbenzoate synthase
MSGAADRRAAGLAERLAIPGIDAVVPFSVPLTTRFRGVTERKGVLIHGPCGWGEWSPFDEYDDEVAAIWLASAVDSACSPIATGLRDRIPVNVTVPAVGPEEARAIVESSGCGTAKVKVAEPGQTPDQDVARVSAVRAALGPAGRIRIDANAAWTVEKAVEVLSRLEDAAGGLEYVEQPCAMLDDLAEVRARTGLRIAADEAIRRDRVEPELLKAAVDVAVVKVQPSGGVTPALALCAELGLPAVVSSALETSVGLAAGVRLAASLPALEYACGLATGLLLSEDVVEQPLRPVEGELTTAQVDEISLRSSISPPSPSQLAPLVRRLERVAASFAAQGPQLR